jgi:hypothetical protein
MMGWLETFNHTADDSFDTEAGPAKSSGRFGATDPLDDAFEAPSKTQTRNTRR